MHTDFSRGRSGGLVFPSLSELCTIYCDSHNQRFCIVNKAEIDIFLELSCFFHDPADVGNLISGSSAFSKSSFTISQSLLKFMSICVSDVIQPSHPLSLPSPLAFHLSQHQGISNELAHPSGSQSTGVSALASVLHNEYSGFISFRIDRFDLLTVQVMLKSLLQHHSLKASILQHSAFFMVQLSHLYVTTGKTIALTIGTFVGKVMSLLFNTLSRFVIAYLPSSKHLLISWLQSPSAGILEPKK